MPRLIALPFALVLILVCLGLIAGGVVLLGEAEPGEAEGRRGALLDLDAFSDNEEPREAPVAAIAGASLIGFGVLGAIAGIALLILALSGDREGPAQQQQQQVVVIRDPEARVHTDDRV